MATPASDRWPALPYADWSDTVATLQLWTQIVGKTALKMTPWINHSWHIALHLTSRGLTTPLLSYGASDLQIAFDFIDHAVWIRLSDGRERRFALRPMSVAHFHKALQGALSKLGVEVHIDPMPNEISDPLPFAEDHVHRAYDAEFANRFWRVLLSSHGVFSQFRTAFLGKVSPVHFFWGSFDLAVTRFSGRRAPLHPGGVPHLPDAVVREAYSHEVSSAGFWPGGAAIAYPAFYSYAYPQPAGFPAAAIHPDQAFFSAELGEFILPYDVVRTAPDPERVLLQFLQSSYEAAADLGDWHCHELECAPGQIGVPRIVKP
jgi:hypothetical protein